MIWHPMDSAPRTGERVLGLSEDGWVQIVYWALELEAPDFLDDSFNLPESQLIGWAALPVKNGFIP